MWDMEMCRRGNNSDASSQNRRCIQILHLGKTKIYQYINAASILDTIVLIQLYTNRKGNIVSGILALNCISVWIFKKGLP